MATGDPVMNCSFCRDKGLTPDSLIEKCIHCGEYACADSHIEYVDKQPVCAICIEWVCSQCHAYTVTIDSWPIWKDGRVLGMHRLCARCKPEHKIVRQRDMRRTRQRQQEADGEEAFQKSLGGPDAS